jgi:hypothetical protein
VPVVAAGCAIATTDGSACAIAASAIVAVIAMPTLPARFIGIDIGAALPM